MTETQPTRQPAMPASRSRATSTCSLLLHDHYLIEQMTQFNRERVPERQPHAKGSGAFGRF
jgi:catalase